MFDLNKQRFVKRTNVKSCNDICVNDLENIKVEILNAPTFLDLQKYIPELVTATWNENINDFNNTVSNSDRKQIMKLFFDNKLIPTAMKSCKITLLLSGITTHDVTHLLRHSGLAFAADCTGDKYITNRNLIIPSFLDDAPEEYKDEYIDIMSSSYELYDKICNNLGDKVHIQDARLVLPRTMETFYYVSGDLFDFIRMLKQRIDLQVQPKSDNIIALRIYEQLVKIYPLYINVHAKNSFYCNESKHQLSSKWYKPLEQNKTEYTTKMKTVYGDMTKMYGFKTYKKLEQKILKSINKDFNATYEKCYGEKYEKSNN